MSEDVSDCVRETRALLQQLTRGLRTVQDFERFESGHGASPADPARFARAAAEVKEDVRWQVALGRAERAARPQGVGKHVARARPRRAAGACSGLQRSQPAHHDRVADRDLLRQALGALATYLLRQPGTTELRVQVTAGRVGTSIELRSDGPALSEEEQRATVRAYARLSRRTALAQGIALAHARAIVELHGGTVRATTGADGAAAFLVELKSRDPSPNHHMGR